MRLGSILTVILIVVLPLFSESNYNGIDYFNVRVMWEDANGTTHEEYLTPDNPSVNCTAGSSVSVVLSRNSLRIARVDGLFNSVVQEMRVKIFDCISNGHNYVTEGSEPDEPVGANDVIIFRLDT